MLILHQPRAAEQDRTDAFHDFARRRARGEVLLPPLLLSPHERRLHVRQTLREDHRFRIENRPEGAQAKFDKLAASPFAFFRGTALLYYRDHGGMDADLPIVLSVGDVHPENFGVMPNEDGGPFFGINDYDEAAFAPFTYDVKRGAVGFDLLCRERKLSKKDRAAVVSTWVRGYLEGLRSFAEDDRERWFQYRIDNSPPMIRALLESAQRERRPFLEKMVDLGTGRFRATGKIVPHTSRVDDFQRAVDAYRAELEMTPRGDEDRFFRVKDVAVKKGSGTASLGLDRYFVLIEGPSDDAADDLVLEFKQARRSVLRGLVPPFEVVEGAADRDPGAARDVVRAHDIHLAGGDPFYGHATLDGRAYVVRERSPFKDEIDVFELGSEELCAYADICGRVLAQTHARSDADTGVSHGQAETRILALVEPALFTDDVVRFARAAAKRVRKDHEAFRRDVELGAFEFFRDEAG